MTRHRLTLALLLLALGLLPACKSARREDPILRLSAEESLAEGKRLFAAKKYAAAVNYFTHAFEVEPNSASGREALLLAADSLFNDGGDANLLQAESRYRDFLNRFPTSERAVYVQLQIGRTLVARMERPDRDQKVTVQAREALEDLLRLAPTSAEAAEAAVLLAQAKDRLAEHEVQVGEFYLRFRMPSAAASRFEATLQRFPDYSAKDRLLYDLAEAYRRAQKPEEAERTRARLLAEYPASEWSQKAQKEGT